MSVPLDLQINLSPTDEVLFNFLKDPRQTVLLKEFSIRPRYEAFSSDAGDLRLVDSIQKDESGKDLVLLWARQLHFQVFRNLQLLGDFEIVVPVGQQVQLPVYAGLFVKVGLASADRNTIYQVFKDYDPNKNSDPIQYVEDNLKSNSTITRDMFYIDYTYEVKKVGQIIEYRQQLKHMEDVWRGNVEGVLYDRDGNKIKFGQYTENTNITYRQVSQLDLQQVPSESKIPYIREIGAGDDPNSAAEDIVDSIIETSSCDQMQKHWYPFMTLLVYPEFRVRMKDFRVEIGCGVWIVITLPVLEIKMSGLELYVFWGMQDLGDIVLEIVTDCIWTSAGIGAVVGVVLWNFVAAIAAFQATFERCIQIKTGRAIRCLVPGLAIVKVVRDDWRPV